MSKAGLDPERITLDWASAAEAPLFVQLVTDFINKIKNIGPLGRKEGIPKEELMKRLRKAKSIVSNFKIRTRFSKITMEARKNNNYNSDFIDDLLSQKLGDLIDKEIEK